MAGIYIHIPFCRQACHYCDFHFSTNLTKQSQITNAICDELRLRSDYVNEQIETIYFGGGTPSVLHSFELAQILSTINDLFEVNPSSEVTLEANPEDLNLSNLEQIRKNGVNRLSIGFQTFSDQKLRWMNRVHSSDQAMESFRDARRVGFKNISIDLIYALPGNDLTIWSEELERAIALDSEHISIYGLTIEEPTVFGHRKKAGELQEVSEEEAASQYLATVEFLKSRGYDHYEVSNFSKPGFRSNHNSSYWAGEKYLGVGPGAHSFDGTSRQFNVRNNSKYLKAINQGDSFFEIEKLSLNQQMNERILTNLRTSIGIDLDKFQSDFSISLQDLHKNTIDVLASEGLLNTDRKKLCLTPRGFLIADEVALKLFFDE